MTRKLLGLTILWIGVLCAQGERGALNGTVTDPTGSAIPSATVRAVNVETNVDTTVRTTDAGVFRMPYLPPGTYRITVSAAGFKAGVRDNVGLAVAQTLTVDFKLEVGQITEQVTISSEPPLIETSSAEIGQYVSKKEFDTWPILVGDGRRQIQQFIFTSLPGTVGGTFQGSINGGQNYTHEILVDGLPLGRFDLQGGSNNEFSPSAEAISEMKLQTGLVGAQYTGGQTAIANFATKSGTNDFHGSGYWYVQNDALRANGFNNNAGNIPRQPFKQHNYGYSFGGPAWIPKVYKGTNRTFFFNNLEHTRVRDFRSTSFSTLPVKDFKNGDFSRLFDSRFTGLASSGTTAGADAMGRSVRFGAIYDPSTTHTANGQTVRDIFPNNIVPKSRWSPVSSKILDVGITDPLFDTMLNNIPAIGTCCPFFDETMATVKVDHLFNTAHRISALANRNFRARNNSPGGRWGVPPEKPTDVYQNQDTPGLMYRLAHDWTVRPTVLNHFAMGYNRFGNLNESVYVDQDWPSKVGLQNVAGTHFPRLNFTSGQPHQGNGIGAGGQLGSSSRGGSYNGSTIAQDDVTIIRGKHNYKVGFENRAYYQNSRGKSGSGDFNFSPIQTEQIGFRNETGHAFASFLLGAVQSTSRGITAANFGHRWRQTGFYFVDDWKTTRKLTLNLGFRMETVGGEYEVAARMSALGIGTPNPGAGGRLGALVFAEDLGRKGFMDRNWKQLSPKFGLAYAFSEKLVMRGGYGVNSSPPVSNFGSLGGTLGFNGSISRNSGNTQLRFAEDPVMFLHERYPDFTSTLPNKNPALANGQGIDYVSPNASRLPYVQNWSLGFQFQLPASFVLETNYIGNKGTRLRAAGYDSMNALPVGVLARGNSLGDPWTAASGVPLPYPGFTGSVFQALKPYPQFTGVGQAFPYLGTSNYNALQVQATRHWRKGLAILAAYTWSKSTGLTDDAINSESIADVFNRGLEKAVTNYHYPSFFKLTWIYDLPIGPNKFIHVPGVLGKIVGGWNLSGIHNARSGDPLSIGGGPISSPIGTARMDLVTGQPIITNSDAAIAFRGFAGGQTFLNKAAFAPPPVSPGGRNYLTRLGTLGPVLPNIRGPMFHSHDIGVQKQYRWTETRVWELRANFTNIINRAGRGNPVTNWASPFFGQITGAQVGGRNIEMSTRFVF